MVGGEAMRDMCRKGKHSFLDPANVNFDSRGNRHCRACRLEMGRQKRARGRLLGEAKLVAGMTADQIDRFWMKVDRSGDCWPWMGAGRGHGYGAFTISEIVLPAHRVAYRLVVGPIPDDLHIDHLCRNRACVNPSHLEPVTCKENLRRGVGFVAQNLIKTHCPHGHEYNEENTWRSKTGKRHCRECSRRHRRNWAIRLEAEGRKPAWSKRDVCVAGHSLMEPDSVYVDKLGYHVCRMCRRASHARWRARKKVAQERRKQGEA